MSEFERLKKTIVSAIETSAEKGTKPYDTRAKVVRVDGEIVWVNIAGGVDETPVEKTIDAKKGDIVVVRVSGGRAYLIGNYTSPPTNDEEMQKQVKAVSRDVSATKEIAEATNQHFWSDDNGVHVSSEANNPVGVRNTLWNSLGMLFRRGANNLLALITGDNPGVAIYDGQGNSDDHIAASFTGSGVVIGRDDKARLVVQSNSLLAKDAENQTFFEVVDQRDADGYAEITENFICYSGTTSLTVSLRVESPDGYTPTISDGSSTFSYTLDWNTFILDEPVTTRKELSVTYKTRNRDVKYYTLGKRAINSNKGLYSVAEGYSTEASGQNSHAEGKESKAIGNVSHAEGRLTKARGNYSHAEGHRCVTFGECSHAEGYDCRTDGECSHAEGYDCQTYGDYSHAQGYNTVANGNYQCVMGRWNVWGEREHPLIASYTCTSEDADKDVIRLTYGYASIEDIEVFFNGVDVTGNTNRCLITDTYTEVYPTVTSYGFFEDGDVIEIYTYIYGNNALIIGNGSSLSRQSNAITVDFDGNVHSQGSMYSNSPNDDASGGYRLHSVSISSTTITVNNLASGESLQGSISCSRAGYNARCVVGWNVGGTGSSNFRAWRLYVDNSEQKIYYGIKNERSSAVSGSLIVYVLYTQA